MAENETVEQVAIVGMAGRFPGAADVEGFWDNLCRGVESIRPFSQVELRAAGADTADPSFINSGAVMDGYDEFDAAFFGMSRREAELTDPQHRVFLETAWAAIENAGYDPSAFQGRIGVFGGVAANTYFRHNLMAHPDLLARTGDYPLLLATEREYAITRAAYKMALTGPAVSVNTACSTSAVAVHLAIGSLLSGESDVALAGGARVRVPATAGYVYNEDGILSADGHCRPFDANARGTIAASGVAMVVLRRLSDAIRDGDTVYAVIRGSAVNNDGAAKVGYTAPSIDGQAAVIDEALAVAEVDADSIGMVEAHGTGTSLGDPIEIAALTRVFQRDTQRRQYCAIGSLKSNVGHLDAAAGVAGIIKAALSLHHEQIPPSINFETPNPQIDFAGSPFFVNTELRPWKRSEQPRRAAVSSFGLGGTNAHVVLEEAPLAARRPATAAQGPQVLTLSAKTAAAVERQSLQLADHLQSNSDIDLADVAWTLGVGRSRLSYRRAIVASEPEEAAKLLRGADGRAVIDRESANHDAGVAFLFPGQGAQHPGMGAGLYRTEPAFKAALDQCAEILRPIIGRDLLELIYPDGSDRDAQARALGEAAMAQPATFAIQYALARLWMSWGVRPAVMVGHSLGEFAAACLAGVFSLDDALRLVAARGRLMQDLGGGGMLAILSDPENVAPLLDDQTSFAAINAPSQVVVSGPGSSIDALEARLAAADIEAQRLPIELAAHSAMMEPLVEPLRALVAGMHRGRLAIPLVSTATGDWLSDDQVSDPEYWGTHARVTVRFSDAVGRLLERPDLVLLEVGPSQTLASLVRQHPGATPDRAVLSSLPHVRQEVDEPTFARRTLAGLWAAGVKADWDAIQDGPRRRVPLPTYPFERERFWVEGAPLPQDGANGTLPAPAAGEPEPSPPLAERDTADAAVPGLVASRQDRIAAGLAAIISDLSGVEAAALDASASFVDLGFDSLFLTQANSQFRKQFGVRITFRQLFEEAPSIEALAAFIDSRLAPEALPDPSQATAAATPPTDLDGALASVGMGGSPDGRAASRLEQLMGEQIRLVQQQLELVRAAGTSALPAPAAAIPATVTPAASAPKTHYLATRDQGNRPAADHHSVSERQRAAIDALVRRSNARTPGSKQRAQQWRTRLADNRTIVGFDQAWKELVYQVVSVRSAGSRVWDVDGNEYIDTALGFGTNLFGHSPDFVVAAVREQLERGYEVGIQNHLLGEVTEMACAATGNARMAYTTSGGEAVETAIRVARTVTGRDRVAYFTDDIHGRSDIVLGRAVELRGEPRTVPMVAGVPQNVVDDAIVLAYGTDRALEIIRAHASELALVLVEPVRTRNPDLQPLEFLRELRRMADESGFLLVFDEIVTGFRAHMGGVQALFDIHADITTYGKVLGGGLPIGVVAGTSEYVDVIDGGPWSFGDDSFPEADITASGGTFIKHPLTLAAAKAVLTHLNERGPSLQAELNERTAAAVAAINDAYEHEGLPIHIEHFCSFFRPAFIASTRFAGLFQYYLREQGVNTNPPSPSFLSTAHSDADIEAVVSAYVEAGRAMGRDGLLETAPPSAAGLAVPRSNVARATPLPVLPNVARFLVERNTPDPDHWNLGVLLRPEPALDPDVTREVVQRLVERHDALRLRFFADSEGWASSIAPTSEPLPISSFDLSGLDEEEQRSSLERHAGEIQESLDLEHGPLFRIAVFDLGHGEQRLLVVIHHFAMDGLSWRPFWDDFDSIYRGIERSHPVTLSPPSTSFEEWAYTLQRRADSDDLRSEMPDWLGLPWDRVRSIPLDHNGSNDANTNASARQVTLDFSTDETSAMLQRTPSIVHKTDLLMTALAEVVADWTGSDTALFDMMGHGRDEDSFDDVDLFGTVGFFISYTPVVLAVSGQREMPPVLSDQIQPILRRGLSFDLLRYMASDATVRQTFRDLPRAQVMFNHLGKRDEIDSVPRGSLFSLARESIGRTHSPGGIRYYPLAISSEIWKDQLRLRFVYSENLHDRSTIEALADGFRNRLLSNVGRAQVEPE